MSRPRERRDADQSATTEIVEKLIDISEVIENRMGLKPVEEKRVNEAFAMLANGPPPAQSTGAKQRIVYVDFLQRVQKLMGLPMVVLCAAGLGSSSVAALRDRVRVDLPVMMKEKAATFRYSVLRTVAAAHSARRELSL